MTNTFTAAIQKSGKWYIGWIEEIPGVNTQGKTLRETRENLKEALDLAIDVNREIARSTVTGKVIRESFKVSA